MDPRAARSLLLEDLRRFMVGPVEETEELTESPRDRYHTGMLSPVGSPVSADEDDQLGIGDDDHADNILVLANMREQGAMGFTFQTDSKEVLLLIRARWADYRRGELDGLERWVRLPAQLDMRFRPGDCEATDRVESVNGVELRARSRRRSDLWSITVTVVNRRQRPSRDQLAAGDGRIYQVGLSAEAEDGSAAVVARPPDGLVSDEEFWNHELLYGAVRPFAVGHGCSASWAPESGPGRTTRVFSEWLPESEVRKASSDVLAGERILQLQSLSNPANRTAICQSLLTLPRAYREWIDALRLSVGSVVGPYPASMREGVHQAALKNLASCASACQRIETGIAFLKDDDMAWEAFCLAMQAMDRSMGRKGGDSPSTWRAFQLAFILMTLESTVREDHPDRALLDLIWFPTAGGKTEAYLGLSAFAMIFRRLARPAAEPGTSVLTRYTLRLLTTQQFDRAARVICACELLRREGAIRSEVPFTIGLFVGQDTTPNTLKEARDILARGDSAAPGPTTRPLDTCPWCGRPIDGDPRIVEDRIMMITSCSNPECEFHSGLPIAVVDEEIYAHPPSMIVATVDKFARMPWEPKMRSLLGQGSNGLSPDLIIQDELHLITDALGTMVALYEAAIDQLCATSGGRAPKVVASTATVRRADHQVRGIFDRDVAQFPPSGLRADDSFFYREDTANPGRLYVGVHAQGRSTKHTLARVLGTLAQSSTQIDDPIVRDPYHTIVTYFNSLRELGGALVLAEDDVQRYMQVIPIDTPTRRLSNIEELTSHLPSHRIPEIFRRLSASIPGTTESESLEVEPLDLLLSSNMISVGVDVDRLGLMVINGQPKTTSEYIQASSRIGRPPGAAGLVVTVYNWTRPRDRSHYERFKAYHSAFYRHVEATSVTPFAARARDRALHAVLVTLARLGPPGLVDNDSAARIQEDAVMDAVRQQLQPILNRVSHVDTEELEETRMTLDRLLIEWLEQAEGGHLMFRHVRNGAPGLLRAHEDSTVHGLWTTPQSMRDVDPPVPVRLVPNLRAESH